MADRIEIDPAKPQAFLSYAHADDDFLGGAISELRKDIEKAVPFVSGQRFKIFQDKDVIGFGQDWLDRLEEALRQARFLIPILTPSYFESKPCRDEVFRFLAYEAAAGRNDLVLPIYLQDTPLVENAEQGTHDDLAVRLADRQYRDWRQLIHATPESAERRAAIIALAREISEAASRSVPRRSTPPPEAHPPIDVAVRLAELEAKFDAERQRNEQLVAELTDEKAKNRELAEAPARFEGQAKREEIERQAPGVPRSFYLGGAALAFFIGVGSWMAGQGGSSSSEIELLRRQNRELIEQLDARKAELVQSQRAVAALQASAAADQAGDDKVAELTEQVEALSAQLADSKQALAAARENEPRAFEKALTELKGAPADQEKTPSAGETFKDCNDCPEMVVIPAGSFEMGSPEDEEGRQDNEGPQHAVTIGAPFALGKYEVTFDEWDACVAAGGCDHKPDDEGWELGTRPIGDVSWKDAQQYAAWLSRETDEPYRLPSEAEWEYAARAFPVSQGSKGTAYAFGDRITQEQANFNENLGQTVDVGTYPPNAWGLHDMHGNVWEWVEDRWHDSYDGAPTDGRAWVEGDNSYNVVRGGSCVDHPDWLRSAARNAVNPVNRVLIVGFRVARTLTP
ncbi:MAG: SUMF1/EgtB/PvdO family nonheme iron enzyme [Alphaproteobacteria bacterium]|nr:SUMF1/EgtB/PvdO family nonheme iron enzyme [Alphaproteobacteria bacterium]